MDKIKLITNLVNHTAGTVEGVLLGGREYNSRLNERKYFVEDSGPEEIIELLESDEEVIGFELEQLLKYYFPVDPVIPNHEQLIDDGVQNLIDVRSALQDNKDIESELIEINIERVCNEALSDNLDNIEFTNNQINEAKEMFQTFATMHKFYRYADDESEAIAYYERKSNNSINEDEHSHIPRSLAFKLAREYYNNRVLYYTLKNNENEIITELLGKLEMKLN